MTITAIQVRSIVESVADVPEGWSNDSLFADIDLDSLDVMEVLLGVQELTEVVVPDGDIEHVQSVTRIVQYLNNLPAA